MTANYTSELQFALELADKARKIAARYYQADDLTVEIKSDATPVTIADETINEMVIEAVKQQYPEHGVLGEEAKWQLNKDLLWVCDPIDDTAGFISGDGTAAFSLALVNNGQPIVAVVSNFSTGKTIHATKDGGTYSGSRKCTIHNKDISEVQLLLPSNQDELTEYSTIYDRIKTEVLNAEVQTGSVNKAIQLVTNNYDAAMWMGAIQPWDVAAFALLVEEAGGLVTDRSGTSYKDFGVLLTNGLIASGPKSHNALIQVSK